MRARAEQLPEVIAAALQVDLSHNEFGQWSSLEVQHTVLWALKDLARRLRVLRFDMGQTFDLTDAEFIAVVTTTTASVFGFLVIVARYLFRAR